MPKQLLNDPIGAADLIKYLDTENDFSFELRCLELLTQMGFDCQHAGSYTDRVTHKPRQFDIRAQLENEVLRLRWAVECKNLAESFPLLVMCVPRAIDESFHDLVLSYDPDMMGKPDALTLPAFRSNCRTIHLAHPQSHYWVNQPVGKGCAQVGKAAHDQSIVANDAEVFEKWSQAVASAHDLADDAAAEGEVHKTFFLSLILPILVVPENTLWKVDFNKDGTRTCDPQRVTHCSFFVGRDVEAGDRMRGTNMTMSHLEILTPAGLEELAHDVFRRSACWFPADFPANVTSA